MSEALTVPTLMEGVNQFSALLTVGQGLEAIFSPIDNSGEVIAAMQQMLDNLLVEVRAVFLADLTDAAVATAAGVAQSAHDFLAVDYVNAQKAGANSAELWTLLTSDTSVARLSDLVAQATAMLNWLSTNPAEAQQTLSLGFTIYGLIVALHRERSINAPDDPMRHAEQADAWQYAALAVERLQPALNAFATQRSAAIGQIAKVEVQTPSSTGRAFIILEYTVQDTWPPRQPAGQVLAVRQSWAPSLGGAEDPSEHREIQAAFDLYRNVCLVGGPNAQITAWSEQLQGVTNGPFFTNYAFEHGVAASGAVIQSLIGQLQATGSWLYNARATIANFVALSGPVLAGAAFTWITPPTSWAPQGGFDWAGGTVGKVLTNATCTLQGGAFQNDPWGSEYAHNLTLNTVFTLRNPGDGIQIGFSLTSAPFAASLTFGWGQDGILFQCVDARVNGTLVEVNRIPMDPPGITAPTLARDTVTLPASAFVRGANSVTITLKDKSPASIRLYYLFVGIYPASFLVTTPSVTVAV